MEVTWESKLTAFYVPFGYFNRTVLFFYFLINRNNIGIWYRKLSMNK